ncbi:MAG: hypothetical protein J5659_03660 [Clostridia bacterium]|nr:hypothetical protein [Clostridia bacterium]
MEDFIALIIGSDINAYYLARCYHELTGKKADMLALKPVGEKPFAYTRFTKIHNIEYVDNIWEESVFLSVLDQYYENHKDKKILLVSSNETYGEFIAKNQDDLRNKFYFNYPSVELQRTLVNKELFYKTYADSVLCLPKTVYFDVKADTEIPQDLVYPIIVKPANVVLFKHITFNGKRKIYRLNTKEELKEVIGYFKNSDYDDTLIIQEYIPGDDSHLFDAVVYMGKDKKAKLCSFAQIGLQEHSPRMIGNAAVLINGYSQFEGVDEQIGKIVEFMEDIDYQGFAEFDMKYDSRDGKYKVMEINARQGRCSYYITPCGYNLIEVLYRDLIANEDMPFEKVDSVQLETFVPKPVAKKYIVNEEFRQKALSLWKHRVDPLRYNKDNGISRKLMLFKIGYNYKKAYKKFTWNWN